MDRKTCLGAEIGIQLAIQRLEGAAIDRYVLELKIYNRDSIEAGH
jgi:hypothetical protein